MSRSTWKQIIDAPLQVMRLAWQVVTFPFQALAKVLTSRSLKPGPGDYAYGKKATGRKSAIRKLLLILTSPFHVAARTVASGRKEWLWCVPALIVSVILLLVAFRFLFDQDSMRRPYRLGASDAFRAGDFELASAYGQKLVSWPGDTTDADRFGWARSLLQTGQPRLGAQIIKELAPEDSAGYPPAHRFMAISIASRLQQTHDARLREPLRWHLVNSGAQNSEEIQSAYVLYYVETGQLEKAVPYLETAAEKNPIHHITLASIHRSRKDEPSWRNAMREAEKGFRKLLADDPDNNAARIALATTVSRLDRNDEAEQLLLDGLPINDDARLRRALADYYLLLHDQSNRFEQQLALIQQSLKHDINYLQTYQRIVTHMQSRPEAEVLELESLLTTSIDSGNPTALTHFALSNLYSIRGDQQRAREHLEKAYLLNSRFGVIANNLAWMLAHDEENPDLERAHELAVDCVERFPNEPRMRDTLAVILMKQEKYEEARIQFELTLGQTTVPGSLKSIHTNLAFVYEKLGKPRMAEIHRKKVGGSVDGEAEKK